MNSASFDVSNGTITAILESIRKKGVKLWVESGQLRYAAPKGMLTSEEIETLKGSKEKIISFLERSAGGDAILQKLHPRRRRERAPLTFAQLAHWRYFRLGERFAIRQIASATRLQGPLNISALQESLSEIVRRHDALRTRIIVRDEIPVQEIAESSNCKLVVDDLSGLLERCRDDEVSRRIEQLIMEPIDVAVGPLFGLNLLKLNDNEHVLVIAMEHIISDAFSRGILLRDLLTAYSQVLNHRPVSLPTMPVQFSDYAVWQWQASKLWAEDQGAHANAALTCVQQRIFPADTNPQSAVQLGWGGVPVKISRDLKVELREWCRLKRTTLALGVFTAFAGLVLRWCSVSKAVIRYESDGRVHPELQNTIGYFAHALNLHLELFEDDSFVDLMNRITAAYCKAYERSDIYCTEALADAEFAQSTGFNWVPQASRIELSDMDGSEPPIVCSPVQFTHPMLKNLHPMLRELEGDNEPAIILYDSETEIIGDIYFPLSRFSVGTMKRFGRNFMVFVRTLLREPHKRIKDIPLR